MTVTDLDATEPVAGGDETTPDDKSKSITTADVVDFIEGNYDIAVSTDGHPIAIPKKGPRIVRSLTALRATTTDAMFSESDDRRAPSRNVLDQAFEILRGRALHSEEVEVHLRSAYADGVIHVDTGTPEGYIIRIDRDGWGLADGETPVFRRTRDTRPLAATPIKRVPDAREEFAKLMLLDPDSDEFRLVWGWLVGAWFASVPRPLLWSLGGQGSGKTTRMSMVLNIVDPAKELGGTPGKNERDETTAAAAKYVPSWDNLGAVSKATSDWVCRLVTGVAITRRALYSDDDTHTLTLMRTGVATSITLPHGLGPDALERIVPLNLTRISNGYLPDDLLDAEYERLRGSVLAAVWDDVVGVLDCLDDVEPTGSLRMAGYARVQRALDLHYQLTDRTPGFEAAYAHAIGWMMGERVEDDPFLQAMVGLAKQAAAKDGKSHEASAAVLVDEMHQWLDKRPGGAETDLRKQLPGERGIRAALVNAAEPLAAAGVTVSERKSSGTKLLVLTYSAPETPE